MSHHMHSHSHAGAAGSPATPDHRRRLTIVVVITGIIVAAQLVGSIVTGSLALLTDTVHALTDLSGLVVALVAATLMLRPATAQRTWGFRRVEVIAALGQAVLLLVVGGYAVIEGVQRLFAPPVVPAGELLVFGVIGLCANLAGLLVLHGSREANLNLRAAFLEVLNDALGSLGVIVAAIVIWATGFQRADALAGLFIAALILPRAFVILRETIRVLMEFVPEGLDLEEVRRHLVAVDHVVEVHDLHASAVSTGLPVLTAHVVLDDECFIDGHAQQVLRAMRECVDQHFDVAHTTFQLEAPGFHAGGHACSVPQEAGK